LFATKAAPRDNASGGKPGRPRKLGVFHDGWGKHRRWGTLVSSTAHTGSPLIALEYSDEARSSRAVKHGSIIDGMCDVPAEFSAMARNTHPGQVTRDTRRTTQGRIDDNIRRLR